MRSVRLEIPMERHFVLGFQKLNLLAETQFSQKLNKTYDLPLRLWPIHDVVNKKSFFFLTLGFIRIVAAVMKAVVCSDEMSCI